MASQLFSPSSQLSPADSTHSQEGTHPVVLPHLQFRMILTTFYCVFAEAMAKTACKRVCHSCLLHAPHLRLLCVCTAASGLPLAAAKAAVDVSSTPDMPPSGIVPGAASTAAATLEAMRRPRNSLLAPPGVIALARAKRTADERWHRVNAGEPPPLDRAPQRRKRGAAVAASEEEEEVRDEEEGNEEEIEEEAVVDGEDASMSLAAEEDETSQAHDRTRTRGSTLALTSSNSAASRKPVFFLTPPSYILIQLHTSPLNLTYPLLFPHSRRRF